MSRRKRYKPGEIKRVVNGIEVRQPFENGRRYKWLNMMIQKYHYMIGAEIGVGSGMTSKYLLCHNPNLHLFLVDLWAPVPDDVGGGKMYKDWDFKHLRNQCIRRITSYNDRVHVLRGLSWEMSDKVMDSSLDFIFIDADHEYRSVVKDIKAWTPKLKPHGLISGHDTHFPDVLKAVQELIQNYMTAGVDQVWYARKEDVLC